MGAGHGRLNPDTFRAGREGRRDGPPGWGWRGAKGVSELQSLDSLAAVGAGAKRGRNVETGAAGIAVLPAVMALGRQRPGRVVRRGAPGVRGHLEREVAIVSEAPHGRMGATVPRRQKYQEAEQGDNFQKECFWHLVDPFRINTRPQINLTADSCARGIGAEKNLRPERPFPDRPFAAPPLTWVGRLSHYRYNS